MAHLDRIAIEPGKRSGKPCTRGLRMTVSDVLDYLASGMSEDDVLRDFSDLTGEDIRACLAFAAERERRLVAFGGMGSCNLSPRLRDRLRDVWTEVVHGRFVQLGAIRRLA